LFSGRCTFEHDGREFTSDAPSCVYTPANVVHKFTYEPGAAGVVISVSPDFSVGLPSVESAVSTAMLRLATRRIITVPLESMLTTRSLVKLLHHRSASLHRYRRDMLRYLFSALLLELDATSSAEAQGGADTSIGETDLFKRYRDLIVVTIGVLGFADTNSPRVYTVETFAARLSSTPYALNAACQSVCGCPARELIQTAVLEQATRLLLYTKRSVKEISFVLGYSHASHFARFFKQRRGIAPGSFRAKIGVGRGATPNAS
jgi:AraC family transcriptional activator of pobA